MGAGIFLIIGREEEKDKSRKSPNKNQENSPSNQENPKKDKKGIDRDGHQIGKPNVRTALRLPALDFFC